MSSQRPLVLILGATGRTGQSIVQGLLASEKFRVAALVRPESICKPVVETFRQSGIEIRTGHLGDSVEKLTQALAGVDIFISTVIAWLIEDQKVALLAAKAAGVKRVIPCDFATAGERGIRQLHDQKLAIRDYVRELQLPYTFVDVGWWMQLSLPMPERSSGLMKERMNILYGEGNNRTLVTDLNHIGTYMARIVADPRTLNQAVIIWEEEVTQLEALEIGYRYSGEGGSLRAKRVSVPADALSKAITAAKQEYAKESASVLAHLNLTWSEYMFSLHVLEENTLANAKRLGYLDVQELYPDVPRHTLEEYAKEFYAMENPGEVF
ncbi:NAD-P-binding protein [Cubamyces sp. BRFM 1775]|nr:NAD-P-binding protein [Cubamyces sp. BRFM 1775]